MVLLKSSVERFQSSVNRKLVASALRKNKANKSSKHIVAIDPATKQLVSGTSKQVATKLGVSEGLVNSSFRKGKSQHRAVKGFQLFRFMSNDDANTFKSSIDKEDKKKVKVVNKPRLDGNVYLQKLSPNYIIKSDGFHENKNWGTAEHRYKLDFENDRISLVLPF